MAKPNSFLPLLKVAYPLMLANITIPLLGIVDTAVLGRLDDPSYLAAMAVGVSIFGLLFFGFNFLRVATVGLTAQAVGGDDTNEAMRILYRALMTAFILGFLLLLVFNVPVLLIAQNFFDVTLKVEGFIGDYYSARILAAPATFANLVFIGWFLGRQRPWLTLSIQAFINILNMVLDIWLVLGLGWNIKGAAWATVIAEYSGLILSCILAFYILGRHNLKQSWQAILDKGKFRRLLVLNTNVMIRTFLLIACFVWFTAEGAKFGTVILAVNAVLMNFFMFAGYALDGIADATQTLVGKQEGKKDLAGLKAVIKNAFYVNGFLALMATLIYFISFEVIIALLTDLKEVQDISRHYALWAVMTPIVGVWCFTLDGIFLGLTWGKRLSTAMIISAGLFFIIEAISSSLYDNHGLWFSMHALLVIRAFTLYWFLHDGLRRYSQKS